MNTEISLWILLSILVNNSGSLQIKGPEVENPEINWDVSVKKNIAT